MWQEREFYALLDSNGVDTCCFMGSGYNLEDYKVGQEFYFTYAYYGLMAKQERPDALKHVLAHLGKNIVPSDRYKLVSKYKFKVSKIWGNKYRVSCVLVKNLRTGVVMELKNTDNLYYCIMAEPT